MALAASGDYTIEGAGALDGSAPSEPFLEGVGPEGRLAASRARWLEPRSIFITSFLVLLAVGTVMVFSASAFHWSVQGDSFFFLRRQLVWVGIALLGCVISSRVNPSPLRKHYCSLLVLSVLLLGIVLVPQVGRNVNASRRWLPLPGGLQFQPSELAKLAVIVFVAGFLSANPERRGRFFKGFLVVSLAVLPAFVLILVEPDFGSAMFVLALAFIVLYLGGTRLSYFVGSGLLFAPIIAWFVSHRWEQVQGRVLGFLDPEKVYQVKHSLIALGSGGLWGAGLGASGQKLLFLPEPHTDFIVSILGEELGFAGCLGIVVLFTLLLWSGCAMVWSMKDLFRFLLGAGIMASLTFQAAINLAVVTASVPTKGIPLPFVSFGGSGLCVTLVQVGLLLSLDRLSQEPDGVPSQSLEAPQ